MQTEETQLATSSTLKMFWTGLFLEFSGSKKPLNAVAFKILNFSSIHTVESAVGREAPQHYAW
jgi:hypothetical protein